MGHGDGKRRKRPRGSASEPGPPISWGCAGNRRRSRRGPRRRERSGSGLCVSRLFPHECAAPAGGVAETVNGGPEPARPSRRATVGMSERCERCKHPGEPLRTRTARTIRGHRASGNPAVRKRRKLSVFRDNWPQAGHFLDELSEQSACVRGGRRPAVLFPTKAARATALRGCGPPVRAANQPACCCPNTRRIRANNPCSAIHAAYAR